MRHTEDFVRRPDETYVLRYYTYTYVAEYEYTYVRS